ncbi:hypothetical protein [Georgenia subflava]|uniref:DUF998 domain-containing protein n=1 Tax=Georgenia subflava TaxID=1622177 RepID=A0A6N7EHZ1_9MICO|nr:hypothetical protein [Georgenia subflava]MPV36337.1 hypothetical protein [Georgenia subflava]
MPTRAEPAARGLVVVALLVSAFYGARAGWARWHVCVDGFDTAECLRVQDHLYDYWVPTAPWTPIEGAALNEGISLLALGLAIVLLGWWAGGALTVRDGAWIGRKRLGVRLIGLPAAASWIWAGVLTARSGVTGEVNELGSLVGVGVSAFGTAISLVLAGLAWGVEQVGSARVAARRMVVACVLLTLAHPLPELVLTGLVYSSHDANPGDGLVRSAMLALCAIALALPARTWRVSPRVTVGAVPSAADDAR